MRSEGCVDNIARGLACNAQESADLANERISNLPKGVIYKGSVPNKSDLPLSNNGKGDVFTVTNEQGQEYIWTSDLSAGTIENWEPLGGADLSEYAKLTDLPTKTSELENDSGFLTQHQSLEAYRTSANQDIIDNNIREVAEGKCKTYVLEHSIPAPTEETWGNYRYMTKWDGTPIDTWQDFIEYVGNQTLANNAFNSQEATLRLGPGVDKYLLFGVTEGDSHRWGLICINIYELLTIHMYIKTGDIIYIKELDTPDRWYEANSNSFQKLETSKVDLTNYYTKAQVDGKCPSGYSTKRELHENIDSTEALVCSVNNVPAGVYMVSLYAQFRTEAPGTARKQYLYVGLSSPVKVINEENYPAGGWFQHTVTKIITVDHETSLQYKVASGTTCPVEVELSLVRLYAAE